MTRLIWPALLLLVGLAGLTQARCAGEREGQLKEQVAALERRNAALEDEAGRVDTVFTRDTVTLTRVRTRTDSLLATDTLWRTDTVYQMLAAERAACDAVVRTCTERVALRDLRITVLDSLLTVERKRKPRDKILGIPLPSRLLMFGAGAVGGYLLAQ